MGRMGSLRPYMQNSSMTKSSGVRKSGKEFSHLWTSVFHL